MNRGPRTWAGTNQLGLRAALDAVRYALDRHAGLGTAPDRCTPGSCPHNETADPTALDELTAAFDLSLFERDVVTLCAGVELDGTCAAACRRARDRAVPDVVADAVYRGIVAVVEAERPAHTARPAPGVPFVRAGGLSPV
jgi:hypothetical protein